MTWLFPLYLLGAAAVVLPVLLHLRKRPPKERVVFSSLMFLEKSPQLLRRRSKLEQWLLLALRCLALLLLALMFARPLLRGRSDLAAEKSGDAILLLLDTSASMRRDGLWKKAADLARERIGKLKPGDHAALAAFDAQARTVWSFEEDQRNAASRSTGMLAALGRLSPGWLHTDLGEALRSAAGAFHSLDSAKSRPASRQIVLISDIQEGARLDSLRGFAWPVDVSVEIASVAADGDTGNLSLSLAAAEVEEESTSATKKAAVEAVRLRVTASRDAKGGDFTVAWQGGGVSPVTGQLAPGASRVLPIARDGSGATTLVLAGDKAEFDNRVFIAPPQPREVRALYYGAEKSASEASSPLYYLVRALQPSPQLRPRVEAADVKTDFASANLVFVSGLADKTPLPAIKAWMEAGGLVVWAQTDADASLVSELAGHPVKASEATEREYAMLADVDHAHPLLRPFADARLRDFTKVRFWHHRKIEVPEAAAAKVLARFDDGAPAWIAFERGEGRLLLLASGWHPADSQLALSTKFVPLLFGWLDAAGFSHEQSLGFTFGDALPGEIAGTGTRIATEPGIIEIARGQEKTRVAVNLAPAEGRTAPMEPGRLAQLGVRLASSAPGHRAALAAAEKVKMEAVEEEARQKGWFWVLMALLAVLAAETWLAGKRSSVEEPSAASV